MKKLILFLIVSIAVSAYAQNAWNTAPIFDGKGYIAHLDGSVNATSNEMTVEFWIKPSVSLANFSIVGKNQFRIMTALGTLRVQVGGTSVLYSNAVLDSGVWTHVAVTFSVANKQIKIYFNGALDNSTSSYPTSFAATSDSLLIGKSSFAGNLTGELDELRIWKTVRTASEIQNNYHNHIGWYGYTNYNSNLIFIETYEFDVYNEGFYLPYGGSHGLFGAENIGRKPSTSVMHNGNMYFTGSSYLEGTYAGDPNVALTGPMTVELWVNLAAISGTQTLLDLTSGGTGGYKLEINSSGKISWIMNQIGTSTSALLPNTWYHIAIVCAAPVSGSQIASIYINGVYDVGFNYSQLATNAGKLRIGANQSTTNYFKGFIDEVRISNYEKTKSEILAGMHKPIVYSNKPNTPKTTVSYNLDGNMYSGSRTGGALTNIGNCRFGYFGEMATPIFHLGYAHETTMDSFKIKYPHLSIPSVGTAGYTFDTLKFPSAIAIDENNIKVFVSFTHDAPQELQLELISPNGDSIILDNQNVKGKGFTGIIDNQKINIISNTKFIDLAPRVGSYNSFSKFNGKNSSGVWKLKITDLTNGNTGLLYSWGLQINGNPYINNVNNITESNEAIAYPNPILNRIFQIKLPTNSTINGNVSILNYQGKTICSANAINNLITLPNSISSGNYIVLVNDGFNSYRIKIVIVE
jgi:subtilisin-like proprotein convertase family protein